MATIAYLLKPRAPLHLGERGIGIEESANLVHSDTLFSALVSAWRALGLGIEQWIAPPNALRLTSALPFIENEKKERVLFFPKPAGLRLNVIERGGAPSGKAGKKVTLLSRDLFARVIQGEEITLTLPWARDASAAKAVVAQSAQGGRALMTWEEYEKIASVFAQQAEPGARRLWIGSDEEGGTVPRVTVDRIRSSSNIFFCGAVRFAPGCGLYFVADCQTDENQQCVEAALDYLAAEGLGGRRSQGYGQFEWERLGDWSPPQAARPNAWVTLSLYHPQESERTIFADARTRYDLLQRRGWIYSPDGSSYRRRRVTMLAEGAVLSSQVVGDIVDVTPIAQVLPHKVYRHGLAFTLPVALPVPHLEEKP